jgi:enamine deaminase RidA (YjgF/YER057c/UK114 family)
MDMNTERRLNEMGIRLPQVPRPVANYVPAVRVGEWLFTSGVLPMREGKPAFEGRLGQELTVEQGVEAARSALLNALAIVKDAVGDLDRVERVVKLSGYVASAPGFHQQPAVLNGASDLLVLAFGEAGRHARAAVGVASLPLNAPIELELILRVRSAD